MPQLFRPSANTIARAMLVMVLVVPFLCIGLAYAVMRSPYATGENITVRQPVPFSHEHHVGELGIDCRYCHTSVEKSAFAGLPPTKTCMTCHSQLFTNAAMLEPVRDSLAEHKPIHWQRVHVLPGYVYFDHSIHIAKGVGCTTCHGAVDTMPLMKQAAPAHHGLVPRLPPQSGAEPAPTIRNLQHKLEAAQRSKDQLEQGRKLLAHYLIHTEHLTDCSVCHR